MRVSLQDVELRHLAALRAVAEEGTFGRAAERLGYTQSAVSQQIAMLEKRIGGSLFERRGGPRPVEITPLGRRLLEHAASLLDGVSVAEADLDRFLAGQVGTISIGTYQSVSVRILPSVIRRLREERPALEVQLDELEDESELLARLRSRSLDVVFLSKANDAPDIRSLPLIEDPFVLISPRPGVGLDLPGERVAPAALDGQPMVSETITSCSAFVEESLSRVGANPDVVFRTHDNATVQAMVRSGMGHAVMPALAVDTYDPDVVIRLLDPPIPPRRIAIAILCDRAVPPVVEHLIEVTREVASEAAAASELLKDLSVTSTGG